MINATGAPKPINIRMKKGLLKFFFALKKRFMQIYTLCEKLVILNPYMLNFKQKMKEKWFFEKKSVCLDLDFFAK